MSSKDVTKAVAKKLKYYVDVKRREDGFDLSGPYLPPQDPAHLRPGPTLAYDGLHDRSLKHYFRNPEVKRQIGKMTVPVGKSSREVEIRRMLDTEMAKRSYKLKLGPNSPYLSPNQRTTPKHRPQALISVDEYLKTKKGEKQRKIRPDVVGKPRRVLRRSPPQYVYKNEQERLVNMAARLIVATEKAALPGNRSSQVRPDSSTYESSLQDLNSDTEDSLDTEVSMDIYPRPPSRAGGPRSRWTPPRSSTGLEPEQTKQKTQSNFVKTSVASSDTSENIRIPINSSKGSNKKNTNSSNGVRPTTAGSTVRKKPLEPSLKQSRYRPQSARIGYRGVKENGNEVDVVISNGQNGGGKDAQKKKNEYSSDSSDEERNDAMENSRYDNDQDQPDSKMFYKRSQNMNTLRGRILTYQVYVVTGDRRGAATDEDIKLTLFGDIGTSGERALLKSMNHSQKFRRGQVDIFPIDSVYLGDLQNIRIGHAQTSSGHGWFLEKVFISEGERENQVFEFPCKRWFSSKKDDGQIIRDLCVSQVITESELTDKLDDYHSPVEASTDDESNASFSSVESRERGKEAEEKRFSSDEERTPERKNRQKSNGWTKKKSRTKKDYKEENGRKKTVSFEGEKDEKEDSNRKEEKRKSDEESRSESEKSFSEGEEMEVKKSEVKNSEDIRLEVKKTKSKRSEVKTTEDKEAEGRNSKEDRISEVENSKKDTTNEKLSEEEDFWSNSSEKGEPIQYDLGIDDNELEKSKEIENSNLRGVSSSENNSDNDKDERVKDEDGRDERDDYVSQEKENSEEGAEKKETDDEDEQRTAGKQEDQNSKEENPPSDQGSNKEYMAGFLAGVRASEHEKDVHEDDDQSSDDDDDDDDDDDMNESKEDRDFIMTKGPSLHAAVVSGNLERVKELMQHKPSLKEETDEKGWIALHIGCANGQLECVKLIAVSGGNLEEETPTGYTSMHLAAMNGHVNCMMVLFALGADISCRTIDEYTPLHLAAMSGHVECVKWLLANRSKVDATDVNGRTPVDIAEEYCHDEVAKLLKSFKKEVTRSDSTLAHLMTYEGNRKKSTDSAISDSLGASNKIADSGFGGLSGEESWVSDNDDEEDEKESNDSKPSSVSGRPSSAKRPGSARSDDSVTSKNRTDSITSIEEKQKLYEKQRQQMKKRNSSFLDSIRMDVEDDFSASS